MVSASDANDTLGASGGNALLRAVNKEDAGEVKKLLGEPRLEIDVRDRYGFTPLLKACMRGNKELVNILLDKGADLEAVCHEDSTPLFLAAMCSASHDVIELLLSRGARMDAVRKDGGTILHAAASGGNMNTVKFFLESKKMHIDARRRDGATVLLDAVQHSGNKNLIEYLISKGADINAVDARGANVMSKALYGGKVDLFDFLLLKGAKMKIPGSPPLIHFAAMGGHKESVDWLLAKKVDVNETSKDGMTALMHACKESGNVEVLKLLISKGADVLVADSIGYTALHYAVELDLEASVDYLLSNGAKVNAGAAKGTTAENGVGNGATPLFLALLNAEMTASLANKHDADVKARLTNGATLLHAATEAGVIEVVKFYISKGIDVNTPDGAGRTPLMYACETPTGSLETAKFLISRGAKLDEVTNDGATILHLAACGERLDAVDWLVKTQGMDIDIRRDVSGCTPLMTAAQTVGKIELINALIHKGANPKLYANNGSSLMQLAALGNQLELVMALAASGSHDLHYQRPDGATVLHAASFGGDVDLVKYLLAENCNVGQRLRDGSTVVHCAAEAANLSVLRFYLKVGVPVDVKKANGATPLFVAAQHCVDPKSTPWMTKALELLLEAGANAKHELKNGFGVLHYAALGGAIGALDFFLEQYQRGSLFKDVDVKASSTGATPLHVAASRGHLNLMDYLINKYHAKKDAVMSRSGATALHCAAESGKLDAVEFLLSKKIKLDVEAKRNDGSTALHVAALKGDVEMLRLLVRLGANAKATAKDKSTAFHFAAATGAQDAIKYFVDERILDANVVKDGGETPVHLAARMGDVAFIEFLVSVGGGVRTSREDGSSALHIACEANNLEMAQYLVKKGLDVNAKRKDGATCLHAAAYVGNVDLVGFLMARSGDVKIAMEGGATPIHVAAGNGQEKVLEFFAEKGCVEREEVQRMLVEAVA